MIYSTLLLLLFYTQTTYTHQSTIAVLRNFGGLNKEETQNFLFPRIAKYILTQEQATLSTNQINHIWENFSALDLIRNNVDQTRLPRIGNSSFELRNIMMITDNTALFKILFDADIIDLQETNVIFGSQFKEDKNSNVYLYRTIDKVRSAMIRGDTCVLLKLEQLYDSLYVD